MIRVKNADPPNPVGGLEGIEKRVGSRGEKSKSKSKSKSVNVRLGLFSWLV